MNARQAAKYYKKKYNDLKHIMSTNIKPNIEYVNHKIVKLSYEMNTPKQEYCEDIREYQYNINHIKYELIHKIQDELANYININKDVNYDDYIQSQYKETYRAEIYIVDNSINRERTNML